MSTPLSIRPYQAGDHDALVALWGQVFADDPPWNEPAAMIRRKLAVQPDLLLVARFDDVLAGAVVAGFEGVRGWIHHLAVRPDQRRRGLATALVRAAEAGLAALGCPKVNLQVRAENSAVLGFYASLGYAREERVSLGRRLEPDADSPSRARF